MQRLKCVEFAKCYDKSNNVQTQKGSLVIRRFILLGGLLGSVGFGLLCIDRLPLEVVLVSPREEFSLSHTITHRALEFKDEGMESCLVGPDFVFPTFGGSKL